MSTTTTTTKRSTRKPFAIGTRVQRNADGARGTVESVKDYAVDGVPTWAVAVRTDSDGEVWSGTQDTAARGAWRKLSADELREDADAAATAAYDAAADELRKSVAVPVSDLNDPAVAAAVDAWHAAVVSVPESTDAPADAAPVNVPQKSAQTSWCRFPECVHHSH